MATNCDLYDIWAKACNHYDIPEDSIRSWYERIRNKLSENETKRVYHNWSCMLAHKRPELERVKPHIVLAAFFQYYEFELDKNCAAKNSEIFREFCRDAMVEDNEMKQTVCLLLGEKSSEAITSDVDDDMTVLQDLDLLILASSPETYKNYAELSRQEWLNSGKTNYDLLRYKTIEDDMPSTSRRAARKKSPKKKSPNTSIQKFQKIRDDKVKKLIKRSKQMIQDKSFHGINTRSPFKGTHAMNLRGNRRAQNISPYKQQKSKANAMNAKHDKAANDDDDCILIEQELPHVTILDDDDSDEGDECSSSSNDTASKSKNSEQQTNSSLFLNSSYELLAKSFAKHHSSTPCGKRIQSSCASAASTNITTNNANASSSVSLTDVDKNQYFVDLGRNKEFMRNAIYNTIAPLTGKQQNKTKESNNSNNSVIVLDDTVISTNNNTSNKSNSTLKNQINDKSRRTSSSDNDNDSSNNDIEEGEIPDDSVIFVSETNENDFIPIGGNNDDRNAKKKRYSNKEETATSAGQHYSNLLNKHEKKQLQEYNSNTYNPNAGIAITDKKRMVIIDGSNVAFKHSSDQFFSVKGLKIAIEYFVKLGHEVKAVIPQYRMNQTKSSDPGELLRLHKAGHIVQTPCKNIPGLTSASYDDRFILQLASELDAAVVSNDNYRDLLHENAAFKKIIESQVIGYTWCNDIFLLPKDPYGKWGPTLPMILNRS